MIYVLDNNSLRVLGNYYPTRFPTLWQSVDRLVANGRLISTREVRNELDRLNRSDFIKDWVDQHKAIFLTPTRAETAFVQQIFAVAHFQQNLSKKSVLQGTPVADPFVVALAQVKGGTVVTEEGFKPNAAKIPNICRHFNIPCKSLEQMMETEGWSF